MFDAFSRWQYSKTICRVSLGMMVYMTEHSEGAREKYNWVPMREMVIFETYDTLRLSLLKEMNDRGADAAIVDVVHIPDGFPELASARAELMIEKRGSGAPRVTFGEDSTPLFPAHEFRSWWQKHFGQKLSFDRASFRLSKISRERPREAPQKEAVLPEDESHDHQPLPQGIEVTEPVSKPEDVPENTYRTFRDMQRALFEFFAEERFGKNTRAHEAHLVLEIADGQEPLRIRIEQPNPRARVVWAYPAEGSRFSLVSPMAERELDSFIRARGRGRAHLYRLEPTA